MDKKSTLRETPLSFDHGGAAPAASPLGSCEVSVKEAKAKLTELLRRVEAGERITLTRHGKPVADLVPHGQGEEERPMSVMERYEAWRKENPPLGIGWVSPAFDDPLPEDFLLQPLPDDFDEKLAEHDRRIQEARRKRDERDK
jgi:prevent-host-death family protein